MSNRSRRARSLNRAPSSKKAKLSRGDRNLTIEKLEPREVLSGTGWMQTLMSAALPTADDSSHVGSQSPGNSNLHPTVSSTTTGPSFAKNPAITGTSGTTVYGKTAAVTVLGSDSAAESTLTYTWQLAMMPSGGNATFSANGTNAAKNATFTFTKCGTYEFYCTIKDASGKAVETSFMVTVAQGVANLVVTTSDIHTTLNSSTAYSVTSASQSVSVQAYDQFGNAMQTPSSCLWALTSSPSGSHTTISSTSSGAGYQFNEAGAYTGTVTASANGQSALATFKFNVISEPTYISAAQQGGAANVTTTNVKIAIGQVLDQFHNPVSSTATYAWSATTLPSGASSPTYSTLGTTSTVTFKAAGSYVLKLTATVGGSAVSTTVSITVVATPTSIKTTPSSFNVSTTTTVLPQATVVDQFGNTITSAIAATWSVKQGPSGAPAVKFAGNSTSMAATFGEAGSYVFTNTLPGGLSYNVSVTVVQSMTTVKLTPNVTALTGGATQQFSAQAIDQFGNAMANPATFTWSASSGTITGAGLFTAVNSTGKVTVTVSYQSVSTSDVISVTATNNNGGGGSGGSNFLGLGDATLAALVQSLDASGSITRNDMIQIFDAVAAKGTLSATDFSDLKTILADASKLDMPGYVQVLSSDVIAGNAANATYQGAALGNLAAGSTVAHLNDLVGKWFLGTDLPTMDNSAYTYGLASGSLFPTTPSHLNEYQGELGDCYFISTLGMIADQNPSAIENMFINNGDGTFTVRFYGGAYSGSYNSDGSVSDGFVGGNGTADYVTVNLMLPSYGGEFVYSDYGQSLSSASNSLWLPLAEKAYAQWNQTGKEGRDNSNTYAGMAGGWMGTVDAQVLGYNATDYYSLTVGNEAAAIAALNDHIPLTMATNGNGGDGLYGDHAYGVIGYNASTSTFTLYNPWGFDQAGQLTWAQLEATCDGFSIASPTSPTATPANPLLTKLEPHAAMQASAATDAGTAATGVATTVDSKSVLADNLTPRVTNATGVAVGAGTSGNTTTTPSYNVVGQSQTSPTSLDARSVDAIFANLDASFNFANV